LQGRQPGGKSYKLCCYQASTQIVITFVLSSPNWLITLTAIFFPFLYAIGCEVCLYSLSQASSSISTFTVFSRAFFHLSNSLSPPQKNTCFTIKLASS